MSRLAPSVSTASDHAQNVGTLPSREAWYLVFALTVCNIIATVDRMAMTLLVTPMQQSLGLSASDAI